jgi:hypothetical protein
MPSTPDHPPLAAAERVLTSSWAAPIVGLGAAILVGAFWWDLGWIPHDEGLLGQTAERVLLGERPHVDFTDTYTGGLAQYNALAFRFLGIGSRAMRHGMLPFFAAFAACIFALTRRFTRPVAALLATALATLLTLPNYPAAMPSWYGLFLAAVATWCAVMGLERKQGLWWLAAGAAAGVSFLFKITGLYLVAALVVLLLEHERSLRPPTPAGGRSPLAAVKVSALLALATLCLLLSWAPDQPLAWAWHFGLPFTVLPGVLALREWRCGRRPDRVSMKHAVVHGALLGLGVALPIAVFTLPYAMEGHLSTLYQGLFVLPARRIEGVTYPLPEVRWVPLALLWLLVLLGDDLLRRRTHRLVAVVVLALTLAGLVLAGGPAISRGIFMGLRVLPTAIVLAGAAFLWRSSEPRPLLLAVLAPALLLSLMQTPFAGPLYFLYFAPLLIPLVAALLQALDVRYRSLHGVLLLGLIAFVGLRMGWVRMPWYRGEDAIVRTARLDIQRTPLRIPWYDAQIYEEVDATVRALTQPGEPILALPDCPEISFLTETTNPTPVLYEVFADPETMNVDHYVRLVNEHGIRVMVVNEQHRFSGEGPHRIAEQLKRGFDHHRSIAIEHVDPQTGQAASTEFFTVHWRGTAPAGDSAP